MTTAFDSCTSFFVMLLWREEIPWDLAHVVSVVFVRSLVVVADAYPSVVGKT